MKLKTPADLGLGCTPSIKKHRLLYSTTEIGNSEYNFILLNLEDTKGTIEVKSFIVTVVSLSVANATLLYTLSA